MKKAILILMLVSIWSVSFGQKKTEAEKLVEEGVEPYAYIAFASSETPDVVKWLNGHNSEMENFLNWSLSFSWKKN
ncbi:MAG TPA: hypothetical protein VFG10_08400 [Saprospiraceae bacterium]|nr:hypothetical protein [Saprospiraceae bacterium]